MILDSLTIRSFFMFSSNNFFSVLLRSKLFRNSGLKRMLPFASCSTIIGLRSSIIFSKSLLSFILSSLMIFFFKKEGASFSGYKMKLFISSRYSSLENSDSMVNTFFERSRVSQLSPAT